jgi:hypothetical protein
MMLERLMFVLADVARLADVDGYLGNPDRDGPASTTYSFVVVPNRIVEARAPNPGPREQASLLGIILACLVVLLIGAGLIGWWAMS